MATERLLEVPHIQQEHEWDCGLACTLMALRFLEKGEANFQDRCSQIGIKNSVWTVDLANLFHSYGVKTEMCTITMGVNKNYSHQRFYKQHYTADEGRVNELFENASELKLNLSQRSVTSKEIIDHIEEGNVAIVLTDWTYLTCIHCRNKLKLFGFLGRCFQSYQGHFILVCGFNKEKKQIFYRNPSYNDELCCSSVDSFDKARKSYGTDEDILFIYKDDT